MKKSKQGAPKVITLESGQSIPITNIEFLKQASRGCPINVGTNRCYASLRPDLSEEEIDFLFANLKSRSTCVSMAPFIPPSSSSSSSLCRFFSKKKKPPLQKPKNIYLARLEVFTLNNDTKQYVGIEIKNQESSEQSSSQPLSPAAQECKTMMDRWLSSSATSSHVSFP